MPSLVSDTETARPTGVERFKTLVELERIRLEMRALAVDAFGTVSTDVPADAQEWVYDLRRGKNAIGGGTLRFFTLLARRAETPDAHYANRALGLSLLALLHRALDLLLPEIPEPAPRVGIEPRDPSVAPVTLHTANAAIASVNQSGFCTTTTMYINAGDATTPSWQFVTRAA